MMILHLFHNIFLFSNLSFLWRLVALRWSVLLVSSKLYSSDLIVERSKLFVFFYVCWWLICQRPDELVYLKLPCGHFFVQLKKTPFSYYFVYCLFKLKLSNYLRFRQCTLKSRGLSLTQGNFQVTSLPFFPWNAQIVLSSLRSWGRGNKTFY